MSEKADIRRLLVWVQMKKLAERRSELEVVESSKDVSRAQGAIEGYRASILELCGIFRIKLPNLDTPIKREVGEIVPDFSGWDIDKVEDFNLAADAIDATGELGAYREWVQTQFHNRKEYLFVGAEKGTDLHKAHGFRDALLEPEDTLIVLRKELKDRQEKDPLFQGRIQ